MLKLFIVFISKTKIEHDHNKITTYTLRALNCCYKYNTCLICWRINLKDWFLYVLLSYNWSLMIRWFTNCYKIPVLCNFDDEVILSLLRDMLKCDISAFKCIATKSIDGLPQNFYTRYSKDTIDYWIVQKFIILL